MEQLASDTSSFEGGPPFSAEPHGWGISMSVSGEFQRARSPGVHPPLRFDNVVLPGARPEPRVPTPGESATRQARGSHHEEAGGRARRAREARVSTAGRLGMMAGTRA